MPDIGFELPPDIDTQAPIAPKAERRTFGPWLKNIATACIFVAVGFGGSMFYQKKQSTKHDKALTDQIAALQDQLTKLATGNAANTATKQDLSWKSFSTVEYSFEFPYNAIQLDSNTGTFSYKTVLYTISPLGVAQATLADWMAASSIDPAQFDPAAIDGHPAFTSKTGLLGYFMNNQKVYIFSGQENGRTSGNTSDPVFAHLISSFKLAQTGQ
jgi:hypothetical protein